MDDFRIDISTTANQLNIDANRQFYRYSLKLHFYYVYSTFLFTLFLSVLNILPEFKFLNWFWLPLIFLVFKVGCISLTYLFRGEFSPANRTTIAFVYGISTICLLICFSFMNKKLFLAITFLLMTSIGFNILVSLSPFLASSGWIVFLLQLILYTTQIAFYTFKIGGNFNIFVFVSIYIFMFFTYLHYFGSRTLLSDKQTETDDFAQANLNWMFWLTNVFTVSVK